MAKAQMTSEVVTISTGVMVGKGISLNNKPDFKDGILLTAGTGFFISNTIGEYTDNTTKKIKEYIKEKEDEWKNK